MTPFRYENRKQAGTILAQSLKQFARDPNGVILALPRGGVPIAAALSEELALPFDLFFVRKLGLPSHEEFAIGAIASGGIHYINEETVRSFDLSQKSIEKIVAREQEKIARYEAIFGTLRHELAHKTVILVDDGLATGASMKAAVRAVQQRNPRWLVVAVPVGSEDACASLEEEADEVICPLVPESFMAVGQWYDDFSQVEDEEVLSYLNPIPSDR